MKAIYISLIIVLLTNVITGVVVCAPSVSNVVAQAVSVPKYDVFRISFQIDTAATNLYWPYDESPNTGVPVGVGVSVDGLFSNDNWQTIIVQPAFFFQDYQRQVITTAAETRDWIYPLGESEWRIRFSPTAVGEWKYRIRVTDSSGSVTYDPPDNSFICTPSNNRGFVRVSATDSRYFETSDGTYLNLVGLSDNNKSPLAMDDVCNHYANYGINLLRVWWQGSQGPVLFGMSGQGGFPSWSGGLVLSTEAALPGDLFSGKINGNKSVSALFIDVKPNTKYRFSAWVKTIGLAGEGDYGAYLKANIGSPVNVPLTQKLTGDTDWTLLTADITTTSGQTNGSLQVAVDGSNGGSAYFSHMSLREDLNDGQYGAELVPRSSFDAQKHISQLEAWKADYQVEHTRNLGIYLKICLQEKQDQIFGRIQPDGTGGALSDDNVYASATHASRTYQKYFWRYIIARYGYASNIHSYEFCNEGDPFNGSHYNAANAFADYMHQNHPNRPLITTSFWHSLPMEFWKYSACDYIDLHEYHGPVDSSRSHGPRIYAWADPATSASNAQSILPISKSEGVLDFDSSTHHSGSRSIRINASTVGLGFWTWRYHVGIDPDRTYTIRFWGKAQDVGSDTYRRPGISLVWSRAFDENDWVSERTFDAPLGTYSWQQFQWTGIKPPANANTANIGLLCTCTAAHEGAFWVDDVEFIDETSGENIFVDGGFEGDRIDYDAALAVQKYTVFLDSYGRRLGKPALWGEAGIRGPNLFGSPYKGVYYTGENQYLSDDASGVWYRKFIWGQIYPGSTANIYWWVGNIRKYNLGRYAKVFQNFMSNIPLSNGHYVDAAATTSTSALRAWGQKDIVNNQAHLWIDNIPYTWKNVVDRVNVPKASGSIIVTGLKNGAYKAEWWNTETGAIAKTEDVMCSNGSIELSIQNLKSDIVCKLSPTPANISLKVLTPSSEVYPGQTVTITLEYTNNDNSTATNVSVSAKIPAEMTYVPGSAEASGGVYNPNTKEVSWNVDSVNAHQTGNRSFKAKVQN